MTTEELKEQQIAQAKRWIQDYINTNRVWLTSLELVMANTGSRPDNIYATYKGSVAVPLSRPKFAPFLHMLGLVKMKRHNKHYYVLAENK